jgi:hypothetical protein
MHRERFEFIRDAGGHVLRIVGFRARVAHRGLQNLGNTLCGTVSE